MDYYAESTPPKKTCISQNVNMQFKEYMPQQLPVTTQTDNTPSWKYPKIFTETASTPIKCESQIVFSEDCQVSTKSHMLEAPNKVQKLRLLSPKGRDLGQFNVKLQTNKLLIGKPIKIIKPAKKIPIFSSSNNELQIVKSIPSKTSQTNLVPNVYSTSRYKIVHETNKMNTITYQPQHQHIVIIPKSETYDYFEDDEDKHRNDDITCSKVVKASTSATNFVNLDSNSEQNLSEINSISNIKVEQSTMKNKKVLSAVKIPIQANVDKTQHLFKNSSDEQYKHLQTRKKECIAVIQQTKGGRIITALKNVHKIDRNLNQNNSDSSNNKSFNNEEVSSDKKNSLQITSKLGFINKEMHEIKKQNVMTLVPNNEKLIIQDAVSSSDTKNMTEGENPQGTKSGNRQSKDVSKKKFEDDCLNCLNITIDTYNQEKQQIADIDTKVHSNLQDKTYREDCSKDLSKQYNIIQKAVNSIKDNDLRELALKALKDCGIGIQKYIPICSAVEHKSVRDTQIQTEVFGLLDPESFVLINKDIDNIKRIKQIGLQDISDDQNLLSTNDLCSYVNCTPNIPDACEQQNIFDVDNFLKHFEENLEVARIKDTLSATMKKYRNLIDNLHKDFESIKQYDENGMLSIHNAVINNNISFVQRQLLILKYCKENVDILTEDGSVSLFFYLILN